MRIFWGILKWLAFAVVAFLAWFLGWPWVAVLQDNMTAGKYVAYLEENIDRVDLTADDPGFDFPPSFYDNRLFLVGEIHGYAAPQEFDFALLKHLHAKAGVRYYLAEMDPAQAMAVNWYFETGDDSHVRSVFDHWAEEKAQWGNQEFFAKLGKMKAWNDQLPVEERVYFLGVDKFQNRTLADKLFGDIPSAISGTPSDHFLRIMSMNMAMHEKMARKEELGSRYANILANIEHVSEGLGTTIPEAKVYGFWGIFHAIKVPVSGSKPLAMRLNKEGAFAGQVASLTSLYATASYSMMPTQFLPTPLTGGTDAPYTVVPANNDDTYLYYMRGIKDIIKVAGEDSVALFPLGAEGSPYKNSKRLVKSRGFLTGMQPFLVEGSTADAADYVVLFQGSPALTPWKGQAYDVVQGEMIN
jgi:hypothetical protein